VSSSWAGWNKSCRWGRLDVHLLVLGCLQSYVQAIGLHAKLWHCACGHVVDGLLFSAEHDYLKAISNTCLKLDGHVQQHLQQQWAAGMWW
jgi:hypothetical protein